LSTKRDLILVQLKAVFSFISEATTCETSSYMYHFIILVIAMYLSHWLMTKHHVIMTSRDWWHPLYNIKNIPDKIKHLIFFRFRRWLHLLLCKHFFVIV